MTAAGFRHGPPAGSRVLVAMSGGVDSSVAAALSLEAGYDVVGVTLKQWEGPDGTLPTAGCCTLSDAEDARRVCGTLGVPYYVLDHVDEFRREVVVRRATYDLAQAEARAHLLEGFAIALEHLDEVIAIIRSAEDTATARSGLMERFQLSERQTKCSSSSESTANAMWWIAPSPNAPQGRSGSSSTSMILPGPPPLQATRVRFPSWPTMSNPRPRTKKPTVNSGIREINVAE